jgi:hypothetical protein
MSRRRPRGRGIDIFNMSFLDVVSCGFGAIILLLVIVRVTEPLVIEKVHTDLSGLVLKLERALNRLQGETTVIDRALEVRREQLSVARERLARLQGELSRIRGEHAATRLDRDAQTVIEQALAEARQRLSAEQKRLLGSARPQPAADARVGGIPVDSEYVIFIIDTSGSMQQHAWPLVRKKIREVLEIYPRVKGIQVMNDMGDYMFSQYKGRWIPDSPARRRSILKRLSSWAPFSNSSPVEGIEAAIRRFYARDKKISIYIFGDDFSSGSIEQVVNEVERLNQADRSGGRRVRIHAIGFPVLLQLADNPASAVRFAALMRKLAETNGGSFVGLNSVRR